MKKLLSLVLAFLVVLAGAAFAGAALPATRTSVIMLEGVEEEITETQHIDGNGYSIWYQADLFTLETPDGQAHFFAIGSTAEGEEPGLLTSESYMLVVPVEILYEDTDAFLAEATGGFDPAVAAIGEPAAVTLENGIEIKSVLVTEAETAYGFYIVTDGTDVLCVSTVCPVEALEGWGARFDHAVKTITFQ